MVPRIMAVIMAIGDHAHAKRSFAAISPIDGFWDLSGGSHKVIRTRKKLSETN